MTKQKIFNWLIIGVLMTALGVIATPALANGDLPDRNPPPPADDGGRDDRGPLGTHIELVAPEHAGAWSVVQWQDVNGHWQSVDGWHGSLDNTGYIRWWVAVKDFGTGPFRWVVGQSNSAPFNLPAGAGQTLTVETEQK